MSLLLSLYTKESLSCNMQSTSLERKLGEERKYIRRGDGPTCACRTPMRKRMSEFM